MISDTIIFWFGVAVTLIVGAALAILIVQKNREGEPGRAFRRGRDQRKDLASRGSGS